MTKHIILTLMIFASLVFAQENDSINTQENNHTQTQQEVEQLELEIASLERRLNYLKKQLSNLKGEDQSVDNTITNADGTSVINTKDGAIFTSQTSELDLIKAAKQVREIRMGSNWVSMVSISPLSIKIVNGEVFNFSSSESGNLKIELIAGKVHYESEGNASKGYVISYLDISPLAAKSGATNIQINSLLDSLPSGTYVLDLILSEQTPDGSWLIRDTEPLSDSIKI